jgi:hypothetical protein
MLNPEENVFWREAVKAKFQEGKKLTRDDWSITSSSSSRFPILSFTLSPIILS